MSILRTFAFAIALAGVGISVMPSSADARAAVSVQIRDRDYDRDYYRHRDRGYHYGYYRGRNFRRCYNDVDVRYRFGHRVRVVERICIDRYGRRYVANRSVIRIGSRW